MHPPVMADRDNAKYDLDVAIVGYGTVGPALAGLLLTPWFAHAR